MLLKMLQALVLLVSLENLLIRILQFCQTYESQSITVGFEEGFFLRKGCLHFTFYTFIHSFILNSTHIRLLCGHQNVGKFIIAFSKYYITSCHNYRKYGGTLHSFSLTVLR